MRRERPPASVQYGVSLAWDSDGRPSFVSENLDQMATNVGASIVRAPSRSRATALKAPV
jgi:hypothetical protein